jgi:hypothetical protein
LIVLTITKIIMERMLGEKYPNIRKNKRKVKKNVKNFIFYLTLHHL